MYRINNEAEINATALISFNNQGIPITSITLNLFHNGFSRRSWMLPNIKNLYKGNGRVRHEYHNIQQGCLQNIQVHSYQSNDKHDKSEENDFLLGGNNHYDIYIFRNTEILGGIALEVITAKDIVENSDSKIIQLINEQIRVSDTCVFSVPSKYF